MKGVIIPIHLHIKVSDMSSGFSGPGMIIKKALSADPPGFVKSKQKLDVGDGVVAGG